jgi:hypothetical protein
MSRRFFSSIVIDLGVEPQPAIAARRMAKLKFNMVLILISFQAIGIPAAPLEPFSSDAAHERL